jgi:UDP-glucose 4-epimerase
MPYAANLEKLALPSVAEVVEVVRAVTGAAVATSTGPRRSGDPAVLVASSDLIRRELGWQPTRTTLEQIVADAWDFARQRAAQ